MESKVKANWILKKLSYVSDKVIFNYGAYRRKMYYPKVVN